MSRRSLADLRAALRRPPSVAAGADALEELVTSHRQARVGELAAVLASSDYLPELRHMAAIHLSRDDPLIAQPPLLSAAQAPIDLVRTGAAIALGRVGDAEALPILLALARTPGIVARPARFAATLLVHRLGLTTEFPPPPDAGPPLPRNLAAAPLDVSQASDAEAEKCFTDLGSRPVGVRIAQRPMATIRQRGPGGMLAVNADLTEQDPARRLLVAPCVPLLLAWRYRARPGGRYYPSSVVLSTPEEDGEAARLTLCCISGRAEGVGRLDVASTGTAQFWLSRGSAASGEPFFVAGNLGPAGVTITIARAGGPRRSQQVRPEEE